MRFIHSLDVGFSVNKTSSKLSGQATWEALQIVQCTWELKIFRLWCHNTHCTLDCSTQYCEHTPVKQHQAWTWISQQRTNNKINCKLSIKDHHQQQHNHQRKEFKEDDYNCRQTLVLFSKIQYLLCGSDTMWCLRPCDVFASSLPSASSCALNSVSLPKSRSWKHTFHWHSCDSCANCPIT